MTRTLSNSGLNLVSPLNIAAEHYNNTGSACSASGANFHDVCAVSVTTATTTGSVSFANSYIGSPVCTVTPSFNTGSIWISAIYASAVTVTWVTSGSGTINISCFGNSA